MKSTELGVQRLAIDPAAAADLRAKLRQDPQTGVKQAAQQFEGMLLNLMLKSMRDASSGGGLLDSEQSRFFTAIGDQQLAQGLAAQAPLGFAGLIEKQLSRQMSPATATRQVRRSMRCSSRCCRSIRAACPQQRLARCWRSARYRCPGRSEHGRCLTRCAWFCRPRLAACHRSGSGDRSARTFSCRALGTGEWLGKTRDSGGRWFTEFQPLRRQGRAQLVGAKR
jgi:Rod binding domain-containing protein